VLARLLGDPAALTRRKPAPDVPGGQCERERACSSGEAGACHGGHCAVRPSVAAAGAVGRRLAAVVLVAVPVGRAEGTTERGRVGGIPRGVGRRAAEVDANPGIRRRRLCRGRRGLRDRRRLIGRGRGLLRRRGGGRRGRLRLGRRSRGRRGGRRRSGCRRGGRGGRRGRLRRRGRSGCRRGRRLVGQLRDAMLDRRRRGHDGDGRPRLDDVRARRRRRRGVGDQHLVRMRVRDGGAMHRNGSRRDLDGARSVEGARRQRRQGVDRRLGGEHVLGQHPQPSGHRDGGAAGGNVQPGTSHASP
jgi:hypothetical protein